MPINPCPGQVVGPRLVEPPAVNKYALGAMTAFNVIEETDEHQMLFGSVYKSVACSGGILAWDDTCEGPHPDKLVTNSNEETEIRSCPFHLYSRLDCRETTIESVQADAEMVFDLNEQRGVEREVWQRLIADPASVVLNVDSTPANAFSLVQGVAALESAIANCYPGQATLHGDRGIGIYAANDRLLERRGGSLYTPLDSRWALYAGAANLGPDDVPAPAGHAWIYATSQVTLKRFTRFSPEPVMRLVRDAATGQMTNVPFSLVERIYLPSVECCRFAVLVCLGCE